MKSKFNSTKVHEPFKNLFDGNGLTKAAGLILTEAARFSLIEAQRTRFFTPYRDFTDFGDTLVSPIFAPILCSVITGIGAIVTVGGAIISTTSLFVACGAALFRAEDARNSAFKVAGVAAIITAFAAVITTVAAILTAICVPLLLARILTRSAATLMSPIVDCFNEEDPDVSTFESPRC